MRGLAEFAMRGRNQAILACVGLALVPFGHWLSGAIVSLVLLRKGESQGLLLMLITCLPLGGVMMFTGDPGPLIGVLGMTCLAIVLRATRSWEWTLAAAVLVSGVGSWVFELAMAEDLKRLVAWYLELLAESPPVEDPVSEALARNVIMGLFAMGQAYAMLGFLALARWWQSVQVNPGGFRQEFHQLRLPGSLAATLVGLLVVCVLVATPEALRWVTLLTVPLVMAAIGWVHWLIGVKHLSVHWVAGFYIVLILLYQLVSPLLASLAIMDSWFDLRKQFRADRED